MNDNTVTRKHRLTLNTYCPKGIARPSSRSGGRHVSVHALGLLQTVFGGPTRREFVVYCKNVCPAYLSPRLFILLLPLVPPPPFPQPPHPYLVRAGSETVKFITEFSALDHRQQEALVWVSRAFM
jgi:hypothetical protein